MKAVIDTNVILDAIASRPPFCVEAQKIMLLAAQEAFEGYITASSITDIYYIARKSLSEREAREALRKLFQIFTVLDVRGADCEAALDLTVDDYEDAVVSICAKKAGAAYIITRDEDFQKCSSVPPAISPAVFLKKIIP